MRTGQAQRLRRFLFTYICVSQFNRRPHGDSGLPTVQALALGLDGYEEIGCDEVGGKNEQGSGAEYQ